MFRSSGESPSTAAVARTEQGRLTQRELFGGLEQMARRFVGGPDRPLRPRYTVIRRSSHLQRVLLARRSGPDRAGRRCIGDLGDAVPLATGRFHPEDLALQLADLGRADCPVFLEITGSPDDGARWFAGQLERLLRQRVVLADTAITELSPRRGRLTRSSAR